MLNQATFTIAGEKEDETRHYGNEDLSEVIVTKKKGYYEVKAEDYHGRWNTYFCKKGRKNYYGQTWFAYESEEMTGEPAFEAYTFKNLKGMFL